jgi:hypothetical protein
MKIDFEEHYLNECEYNISIDGEMKYTTDYNDTFYALLTKSTSVSIDVFDVSKHFKFIFGVSIDPEWDNFTIIKVVNEKLLEYTCENKV